MSEENQIISPEESGEITPIRKHNFTEMQVGASMFCQTEKRAKAVIAAAHFYAKTSCPGFKLARRKIHGGYRVWRIK